MFVLNTQNRSKFQKYVGMQDHGSVIVKPNGKTLTMSGIETAVVVKSA